MPCTENWFQEKLEGIALAVDSLFVFFLNIVVQPWKGRLPLCTKLKAHKLEKHKMYLLSHWKAMNLVWYLYTWLSFCYRVKYIPCFVQNGII